MTCRTANRSGAIRILLVLACALWVLPAAAAACSCMPPPAPATAFRSADAVFLATVTEVPHPRELPYWAQHLLLEIDHRFDTRYFRETRKLTVDLTVDASWKGVTATRAALRTGWGGGDCGYPFVTGRQYVVYAFRHRDRLGASICSRTAAVTEADEDLEYLVDLDQLPRSEAAPAPRLLLVSSLLIVVVCVVLSLRLLGRRYTPQSQ